MSIEINQLKRILEAAVMSSQEPISVEKLSQLFNEAERPALKELRRVLDELTKDYQGKGIELKEVASGYRFQVQTDLAPWISRLWEERPPRYSRALLETLALIAYKQPITRAEIEDVRGVVVSTHILKTLSEREWVQVVGHRDVPGKPALYGTTKEFLNYFNLKSLTELPILLEPQNVENMEQLLQISLDIHPAPDEEADSAMSAIPAVENIDSQEKQ